MSLPQVLEVVIGLVVVYYVLGMVVSTITQVVMESLETRGAALERYLKKIAGDKVVDLTSLPQIRALQPIRYENWWSVFGASTEAKKLEKIPAPILVDAFFDMTGLTGVKDVSAAELTNLIGKLPDSEGKQAMLSWIQQDVTDINDLRHRTNAYFTGLMDQAAATFKANARSFVIIFSIAVTLLFGTDSIQLANELWKNSELRTIAAAQANAVAQQGGDNADLTSMINQLSALSLRIGWWQTQALPQDATPLDMAKFLVLKFIGLAITVAAVSQGSSFWYDILKKVTGTSSPKISSDGSGASG
jgi:hypothetical protein